MVVSIRPADFVEGGAVPVDRNLLWKKCRFVLFNYTRKDGTVVATTTAAEITYEDDDGNEFVQNYSVGDPGRFVPSQDGKTLVATGSAQSLSKSSNFYILMSSLVNAGFPENKIPENGDISVFEGLYAYHVGIPEPKRAGLARQTAEGDQQQQQRERVISVPSQIIRLPWEKKASKQAAPAKAAAKPAAQSAEQSSDDGAVIAKALQFVADHLGEDGSTTRQKLAVAAFKDLAKDPDKDAIASLIFAPEFAAALTANGYTLNGEVIKKA